jgi:hypothetical protein
MDKCCGSAGTHEELKSYYDPPIPLTPVRGSYRVPSTTMSEEDSVPFSDKQVQAHGWLFAMKLSEKNDPRN